jgi:hypothetical protein
MSDEARAWAKRAVGLRIPAKSVLNALAGYADPDGKAWPKLSTLAQVTGMSERHVRRQLRTLEQAGLLISETRTRETLGGQTSNAYWLALPDDELIGERPDRPVRAARTKLSAPAGQLSPPIRTSLEEGCSDEQPGAGEDEQIFEEVFAAWSAVDPYHTSRPRALAEWQQWAPGIGAARLKAAAMKYLDGDPDIRRTGPKWLHKWLGDEMWRPLLPAINAGAPVASVVFDGPQEVRTAFASKMGEAWTRAWLDHCHWDACNSAIVAPRSFTANQIRRDVGNLPRTLSIAITGPAQ